MMTSIWRNLGLMRRSLYICVCVCFIFVASRFSFLSFVYLHPAQHLWPDVLQCLKCKEQEPMTNVTFDPVECAKPDRLAHCSGLTTPLGEFTSMDAMLPNFVSSTVCPKIWRGILTSGLNSQVTFSTSLDLLQSQLDHFRPLQATCLVQYDPYVLLFTFAWVSNFRKIDKAALREFHLFRAFNITSEYKLQAAKEPNLRFLCFMQNILKGKAELDIDKETHWWHGWRRWRMKRRFGFFKLLAYCRICSFSHTPRWVFVWKLGSGESPVVSVISVFWFQVLVFPSVSWSGSSPHNSYILYSFLPPRASILPEPRKWCSSLLFAWEIEALARDLTGKCWTGEFCVRPVWTQQDLASNDGHLRYTHLASGGRTAKDLATGSKGNNRF